MRRARVVLALLALLAASCGAPTVAKRSPAPAPRVHDAGLDAAIDAGQNLLAGARAEHDCVAPGAREAASATLDASRDRELALPAFDADTCVRAAFRASAPTAIALVDGRGATLASADGVAGAIGASGPICFRKGDAVTFRFEGQARIAMVVWATP